MPTIPPQSAGRLLRSGSYSKRHGAPRRSGDLQIDRLDAGTLARQRELGEEAVTPAMPERVNHPIAIAHRPFRMNMTELGKIFGNDDQMNRLLVHELKRVSAKFKTESNRHTGLRRCGTCHEHHGRTHRDSRRSRRFRFQRQAAVVFTRENIGKRQLTLCIRSKKVRVRALRIFPRDCVAAVETVQIASAFHVLVILRKRSQRIGGVDRRTVLAGRELGAIRQAVRCAIARSR